MVAAAAANAIDFTKFDRHSKACWRKLGLVLYELDEQRLRAVALADHTHCVTLASHSRLTDESFRNIKTAANTALERVSKAFCPWLLTAEELEAQRQQDIIATFREAYGTPDDPRYKAMVAESRAIIANWMKAYR